MPFTAPRSLISRLTLGTALGSMLALGYGRAGYAGSCGLVFDDGSGSTAAFQCVAPADPANDETQVIDPADRFIAVTTDPLFGIDTSTDPDGGNAIQINSELGVSFDGIPGFDRIAGRDSGLVVVNDDQGNITIDTTGGMVTGLLGSGISAVNEADGGDLYITTGEVRGETSGISGRLDHDSGLGILDITTLGPTEATGEYATGIEAFNYADEQGLTRITVNGPVDGGYGINSVSAGSGYRRTQISTYDTVTGNGGSNTYFGVGIEQTSSDDESVAVLVNQGGVVATNGPAVLVNTEAEDDSSVSIQNSVYSDIISDIGGFGIQGVGGIEIDNTSNTGLATVSITSTSGISGDPGDGTAGDGINVSNTGAAATLEIGDIVNSGDIQGASAIVGDNTSTGDDETARAGITVSGDVTATEVDGDGIRLSNTAEGDSGYALAVVTQTGAENSVTGGDEGAGINIENEGEGAATLTISTEGRVEGGELGIAATNEALNGSADLVIDSTGEVEGVNGVGILARNTGNATLDITQVGNVTGGVHGIDGVNTATTGPAIGTISMSGGNATGTTGVGIVLINTAEEDDPGAVAEATITQTGAEFEVYGGAVGIVLENTAEAADATATITTEGTVTGGEYDGIRAVNRAYGYSDEGDATLEITTGGAVSGGENGFGINAFNTAVAGSAYTELSISNNVSGDNGGVFVSNSANGDLAELTVDVEGAAITSADGDAIQLNNTNADGAANLQLEIDEDSSVTGNNAGVFAYGQAAYGDSTIEITSAGAIEGENNVGVVTINGAEFGNAYTTITATGGVQGDTDGIRAITQAVGDPGDDYTARTEITTSGEVRGESGFGIAATSVSDYSYPSPNGSAEVEITVESDSSVFGGDTGVQGDAIGAVSSVDIDISSGSTVTGDTGAGIVVFSQGLESASTVLLTRGGNTISGFTDGVDILTVATGSDTTADTFVDIIGNTYGETGDAVRMITVSTDGNAVTNAIIGPDITAGYDYGVNSQNIATEGNATTTLTTYGSVTGTYGSGVYALNVSSSDDPPDYDRFADLTINTNGSVSGAVHGVYGLNVAENGSATATVTASDSVSGDDGFGVGVVSFGAIDSEVTITSTGETVSGGYVGVGAQNYADTGSGIVTITSNSEMVTGGAYVGVGARNFAYQNAEVEIDSTGAVTGGELGIGVENFAYEGMAMVTVTSTGTVMGDEVGIGVENASYTDAAETTITSTGDVTGEYGAGIGVLNEAYGAATTTINVNGMVSSDYAGVYVENRATDDTDGHTARAEITVSGPVSGGSYGVVVGNVSAAGDAETVITIEEDGSASGGGRGVLALHETDEGSTFEIVNHGLIENANGPGQTAIEAISDGGDNDVLIENTGTIIGGVLTTEGGDTFRNMDGGAWIATGSISDFNGAGNTVENDGMIFVGSAAGQNTVFDNLDTLANAGVIDFSNDGLGGTDVTPVDRLRTTGDFAGSGGTLLMDAVLGEGAAGTAADGFEDQVDYFHIEGDISGDTRLVLNDPGGLGALTGRDPGDGVAIIQVDGDAAEDNVTLAGNTVLGDGFHQVNIFLYDLETDTASMADSTLYELKSLYIPTLPAYEVYPSMLLNLTRLGALRDRVADRTSGTMAGSGEVASRAGGPGAEGIETWARIDASQFRHGVEDSTTGTTFRQRATRVQAGLDYTLPDVGGGELVLGFNVQAGTSSATASSPHINDHHDGRLSSRFQGIGATLTWYGHEGFYADAQVQALRFSTSLPLNEDRNSGRGYAASVEVGQRFDAQDGWSFTPQAQLSYANVSASTFEGPFGETVSFADGSSLRGRLGVSAERRWATATGEHAIYGSLDLVHEFRPDTAITAENVASHTFSRTQPATGLQVGLGGSTTLNGGNTTLYGGISGTVAGSGKSDVRANVGLSLQW